MKKHNQFKINPDSYREEKEKNKIAISMAIAICFFLIFNFSFLIGHAQSVGINSTGALPANTAMLDIAATDKGLLIPRVSLTNINTYTPITGMPVTSLLVYTNTAPIGGNGLGYYYWDGTKWVQLGAAAAGFSWLITGNLGTLSGTNFLGTLDNQDLDIRTNNIIKTRITTKGQIEVLNTGESVFVGDGAGENDDLSSNENVFVGYHAGFANVTGFRNTAVGNQALAKNTTGNNTAIGFQALYETTTGSENVACGMWALSTNTTGSNNVATGFWALFGNTSGIMNTGTGYGALYVNSTGSWNTATGFQTLYYNNGAFNTADGYRALYNNHNGNLNTASGYHALFNNWSGSNNSAFGSRALYNNTYAEQNVAVGNDALYTQSFANSNAVWATNNVAVGYQALYLNQPSSNSNGLNNTAVGYKALYANTTGTNNTALGMNAFLAGAAYSNSTAIGANAVISASNQVRIGDPSVNDIGGYAAWSNLSDGRFKKNVNEAMPDGRPAVPGLAFILKLRPVTYHLDMDKLAAFLHTPDSLRLKDAETTKEKILQTGFIAQEVEKTAQELGYDFSGIVKPQNENSHYGLRYAEFTVPLVKAVQEQQQLITSLQSTIGDLQTENNNLKSQISNIQAGYDTRLKNMEEILNTRAEKR